MLQVNKLKKSYGARVLFDDVTFTIGTKEVVGLVGRNGSGKSTLFRIIKKEEDADCGEINYNRNYQIGFLDQHIRFTQDTVLKECCQALPPEQKDDIYKAEAFLFGLGFAAEDVHKHPSQFSGGYQLRINLVKSLLKEPDLLLLDEPTNYLDIPSLNWMRRFIKEFAGEVILITHDRHFMDSIVTHVMGLHRQVLRKISGTTEKYYEQLALEEEIYEKTRVNQEKKVKELQSFVDRFGAKATKAKQSQSRVKQIAKMTPLIKLANEAQLGFRFNYKETPAKVLMRIENLNFGYDPEVPLFSDLSFTVEPEDRIAIIGKNGYGKTTLLNVISGNLHGTGSIKNHPDTIISYYQQTNKKKLSPHLSVYDEIASENDKLLLGQVRAICGAMMFSGDDADKKISVLSGGEQGRVLLGKVIARAANVLLLDEPTNHLDMESIQVMTQEIDAFPGGVVFVSHDEGLLETLANKLIVFKNGAAHLFLGTYEEFLAKEGWDEVVTAKEKKIGDRKALKRRRAELVQMRAKILNPIKNEIDTLEKEIIAKESQLEADNARVNSLGIDSSESKEIFKAIGQIQLQIASHYERLDELIEKQDKIQTEYEEELKLL